VLWSKSFKQFFLGIGLVCQIIAAGIYLSDPQAAGVTLNLSGLSQLQASLFISGIGWFSVILYYTIRRYIEAEYRPSSKSDTGDGW